MTPLSSTSRSVAEEDLYRRLKGEVKELYRIGDCLAPRTIEMAVFEGWKIGEKL